jgi:hypothetical protein
MIVLELEANGTLENTINNVTINPLSNIFNYYYAIAIAVVNIYCCKRQFSKMIFNNTFLKVEQNKELVEQENENSTLE